METEFMRVLASVLVAEGFDAFEAGRLIEHYRICPGTEDEPCPTSEAMEPYIHQALSYTFGGSPDSVAEAIDNAADGFTKSMNLLAKINGGSLDGATDEQIANLAVSAAEALETELRFRRDQA